MSVVRFNWFNERFTDGKLFIVVDNLQRQFAWHAQLSTHSQFHACDSQQYSNTGSKNKMQSSSFSSRHILT